MEVIRSNPSSRINPYGVLYKNNNKPEQGYDGKHFLLYQWQETIVILEI
ncbi:hypothetical protein [Tissierella praeacuta]